MKSNYNIFFFDSFKIENLLHILILKWLNYNSEKFFFFFFSLAKPNRTNTDDSVAINISTSIERTQIANDENSNISSMSFVSKNGGYTSTPQPSPAFSRSTITSNYVNINTTPCGERHESRIDFTSNDAFSRKQTNSIGIQCDDIFAKTQSPLIRSQLLLPPPIAQQQKQQQHINNNESENIFFKSGNTISNNSNELSCQPLILISLHDYNILLKNFNDRSRGQNLSERFVQLPPAFESEDANTIRTVNTSPLSNSLGHVLSPSTTTSVEQASSSSPQNKNNHHNDSSPMNNFDHNLHCEKSNELKRCNNIVENKTQHNLSMEQPLFTKNLTLSTFTQLQNPAVDIRQMSSEILDFHKILPLKQIPDLLNFDFELIRSNTACHQFEEYLKSILWMPEVKTKIKIVVSSMYSLALQSKINYTGYKGKQPLKYLKSTASILHVIISSSLVENAKESAKSSSDDFGHKVRLLFQTHLQHTYDRLGNRQKKKQRIISPTELPLPEIQN